MAVAVNVDGARLVGETAAVDSPGVGFAGDELVEHQAMRREPARRLTQRGIHQSEIFIAEAKDGGWLDTDQWFFGGNRARELAHVFIREAFGAAHEPLGERSPAALAVVG